MVLEGQSTSIINMDSATGKGNGSRNWQKRRGKGGCRKVYVVEGGSWLTMNFIV